MTGVVWVQLMRPHDGHVASSVAIFPECSVKCEADCSTTKARRRRTDWILDKQSGGDESEERAKAKEGRGLGRRGGRSREQEGGEKSGKSSARYDSQRATEFPSHSQVCTAVSGPGRWASRSGVGGFLLQSPR